MPGKKKRKKEIERERKGRRARGSYGIWEGRQRNERKWRMRERILYRFHPFLWFPEVPFFPLCSPSLSQFLLATFLSCYQMLWLMVCFLLWFEAPLSLFCRYYIHLFFGEFILVLSCWCSSASAGLLFLFLLFFLKKKNYKIRQDLIEIILKYRRLNAMGAHMYDTIVMSLDTFAVLC